jgi:hypothetical protein
MPEAEQELTAGYHAEYSGMKFAMFFLAEYVSMIAVCMIGTAMYFGGYHFLLVDQAPLLGPVVYTIKVIVLLLVMIWVRGTLPRIRYDRLMAFGWKVMLPLALVAVAWSSVTVILSEELDSAAYIVVIAISWLVFLSAMAIWFSRVGRKSEPASLAQRIEVVSLSGGEGTGTLAFRALDRLVGLPIALVNAITGRGRNDHDGADK